VAYASLDAKPLDRCCILSPSRLKITMELSCFRSFGLAWLRDIGWLERLPVVLALVVIPRVISVFYGGNDVTPHVACTTASIDTIISITEGIDPLENKPFPVPVAEYLDSVDGRDVMASEHSVGRNTCWSGLRRKRQCPGSCHVPPDMALLPSF